jgi:CheY-like chemotaxis protein
VFHRRGRRGSVEAYRDSLCTHYPRPNDAPSLPSERRPPRRNGSDASGLGRRIRRSRPDGRAKPARSNFSLPAEGADDPAAHSAALARDAVRGVRSRRVHPERPVLCALALGGNPASVDVATFKLAVRGHVNRELSLSLADVLAMPRVELAAVNQCSGNSRGLFQPRTPGGQWQNGAMGNARWTGVRLRDVLDRAGVRAGAEAALAMAIEGIYDALVLDRKLPGIDGVAIVRRLRVRDRRTPVLMLSGVATTADRVEGLRAGCDGYLAKPYSFSELLARLEALGRRTDSSRRRTTLRVGDLELDTGEPHRCAGRPDHQSATPRVPSN